MAFPKLFIPRKNYMRALARKLAKEDPKMMALLDDELANYLAIERWANSLVQPSSGSTRRYATVVVAASNSLNKNDADFVCTGTNDNVTIQNAVNAIAGGPTIGKVLLMEGNYTFGGSTGVSGPAGRLVSIEGMGSSDSVTGQTVITYGSGYTGTGVFGLFASISGIRFVNNNNATVLTCAFNFTSLHDCAFINSSSGALASNASLIAPFGTGLPVLSTIYNNFIQVPVSTSGAGGFTDGVLMAGGAQALVYGNTVQMLSGGTTPMYGIRDNNQTGSMVYFNVIVGAQTAVTCAGIMLSAIGSSTDAQVKHNYVKYTGSQANGADGIALGLAGGAVHATNPSVLANIVRRTGAATTLRYGINIGANASGALVVHNDLRTSGGTASLNNAGAGTFLNMDASANDWNLL